MARIIFQDRMDAGRKLAEHLARYANREDVLVLALPRGGVPVAFEVAAALHLPMDVFVVRKLGVPGYEELALGALASGGVLVRHDDLIRRLGIGEGAVNAVIAREEMELRRRELEFRSGRRELEVEGRIVLLVDDGMATGATMSAAVLALRQRGPARIVVAVPVGALNTCENMRRIADEVVCAHSPQAFVAVGSWYLNFVQTTEDEVRDLLARADRTTNTQAARS